MHFFYFKNSDAKKVNLYLALLFKSLTVNSSQVFTQVFQVWILDTMVRMYLFVFVGLCDVSDLESVWICSSEDLLKVIRSAFLVRWYYWYFYLGKNLIGFLVFSLSFEFFAYVCMSMKRSVDQFCKKTSFCFRHEIYEMYLSALRKVREAVISIHFRSIPLSILLFITYGLSQTFLLLHAV